MNFLPEYIDGLPNLSGSESTVEEVVKRSRHRSVFLADSRIGFSQIRSAASIALHMHQPLIPAGGADPRTAGIVSNLK